MGLPAMTVRASFIVGGLSAYWSTPHAIACLALDKTTVIFLWPSVVAFAVAMTTPFVSRRRLRTSALHPPIQFALRKEGA